MKYFKKRVFIVVVTQTNSVLVVVGASFAIIKWLLKGYLYSNFKLKDLMSFNFIIFIIKANFIFNFNLTNLKKVIIIVIIAIKFIITIV